jgi:hypothetical protein
MKLLLILTIFLFSCNSKTKEVKPAPVKTRSDTTWLAREVWIQYDTLVYIITQDSMRKPIINDSTFFVIAGGWEMGQYPHFKDGRTADTIFKHEIIYY